MISPYEVRLKQTAEGPNIVDAAVARAELAALWAREGAFEIAESAVRELRLVFGDGRSGPVTVMMMLAEGITIYFRDLEPEARGRVLGAQALSIAGNDKSLIALTSAWLAHIDFNLHRQEQMATAIGRCLDSLEPQSVAARFRLALTLGDAFMVCADADAAKDWHAVARSAAVALGDHAAISALMHNRAALGVYNARLKQLSEPLGNEEISRLDAEVRSAVNYHALAQNTSLAYLHDNASASIMLLRSQYSQAVEKIRSLLSQSPRISVSGASTNLRCDLILCFAELGDSGGARDEMGRGVMDSLLKCTDDDKYLGFATLERACKLLGMNNEAREFGANAAAARAAFSDRTSSLAALLAPYRSSAHVLHAKVN